MKTHRNSVISPAAVIATGLSVFLVSSATAENRTLTLSDSERVAIFDEAGSHTFKVPANISGTARVLVVGGGGGGGGVSGGGGGGGQVVEVPAVELAPEAELTVVVAAGGAKATNGSGGKGGVSSFLTYEAEGGGGGGGGWSPVDGQAGANGGGAGGNGNVAHRGGTATVDGGFPGGDSLADYWGQGGGGGAAEAGHSRAEGVENPGCGGAGIVSDITGDEVMYGYGGGSTQGKLSGAMNEWGKGDTGSVPATQGQDGTGGGGGGGRWGNAGIASAAGGTGTVVVRYSLDLTQVAADFTVDHAVGFAPFVTTFTATVDAPEGSTPELTWNFGDGSEEVVTTEDTVAHTYSELGSYSVSLTVEAAGKTFVKRYENLVTVVQKTFYVDDDSADPQAPYATEGTAARSLADALALATVPGQTICVAPGTYVTTSGVNSFAADPSAYEITSGITILGTGKTPEEVVFTRSGSSTHRLFYLNHADACIRNVTIRGGSNGGSQTQLGGNVYIGANGGTLEDCLIQKGYTGVWSAGGGNVGMEAGRLVRCVLSGGATNPDSIVNGRKGGSCVYMTGGLIENSLIYGNTNGYVAVMMADTSTLLSCTIAGNSGTAGAGVYVAKDTCKVENCAIGDNTVSSDGTGHGQVWLGANESFSNCFVSCVADAPIGSLSTTVTSVGFVGGGDYHLGAASACRDAAWSYDSTAALSRTDLDGNPRCSGEAVDVGCYEFDAETLSVDFTANKTTAFIGEEVVFTAVVSGGAGSPVLKWDLDGDGNVDSSTAELSVSTSYVTPGVYTVSLTVGKLKVEKVGLVTVGPGDLYVDDDSSEEGVFSTIQDAYAVAIDGATIHVAPGDYHVDGTNNALSLTKAVKLIGEGASPEAVVLRQTKEWKRYFDFKTLTVANANALVANMVIADGSADNQGGAGCLLINGNGGTVSNCVIRGAVVDNTQGIVASGVLIQNGLLTHSVISNCAVRSLLYSNGLRAQGVFAEGNARVENCLIRDMKSGNGAAVVVSGSASMKNCTVVDCIAGSWIQNRGTWTETNICYAVHCSVGSVVNTAAYNTKRVAVSGRIETVEVEFEATDYAAFGPTASCYTTCACDGAAINEGSFLLSTDDFKDYAKGDYHPKARGVLCNSGTSVAGWDTLVDLAGRKRVLGKCIDIGCYEGVPFGLVLRFR